MQTFFSETETKAPIQTQSLVPTHFHRSCYGRLLALRVFSGMAVGKLLQLSVDSNVDPQHNVILIAGIVTALGLSLAFHHVCRIRLGSGFAISGSALSLAAGFGLIAYSECWTARCVFALCVVLALGVDLVTAPKLLQDSLPTAVRWNRTAIWLVMFFVGVAIGIAGKESHWLLISGLFGSCGLLIVSGQPVPRRRLRTFRFNDQVPSSPVGVDHPESSPQTLAPPLNHKSESDQSANKDFRVNASENRDQNLADDLPDNYGNDHQNNENEDVECCGGAARQFALPSFFLSVGLSTVGLLAFWWGLRLWLFSLNQTAPVAFACALPLGAALVFTTAPRTGYVIALLPLIFLGMIAAVVNCCVSNQMLVVVTVFISVVALTSVSVGMHLIVVELLPNEDSNPVLTRVFCTSLFVGGILLLADFVLLKQRHSFAAVALQIAILVAAVIALRRIPTPVVSSLGDHVTDADDPEYADIVASLQQNRA